MKKVFYTLISIIVVVSFTSCKKLKKDPNEYIRYKVNGKAYEILEPLSLRRDEVIKSKIAQNEFRFNWVDEDFQQLMVAFDWDFNPIVIKNYYEWNGGVGIYKKNYGSTEYYRSIKCTSSITDVINNYYSGTFAFVGVGDMSGDTVEVSEGTFRVYLDE